MLCRPAASASERRGPVVVATNRHDLAMTKFGLLRVYQNTTSLSPGSFPLARLKKGAPASVQPVLSGQRTLRPMAPLAQAFCNGLRLGRRRANTT